MHSPLPWRNSYDGNIYDADNRLIGWFDAPETTENEDMYNANMAVSAVNKQMPLAPETVPQDLPGIKKCPNCGYRLHKRYNYCPECGQHLDWWKEKNNGG